MLPIGSVSAHSHAFWLTALVIVTSLLAVFWIIKRRLIAQRIRSMSAIAAELDGLFGFGSTWTFARGDECWHKGGIINIDEKQITRIMRAAGADPNLRELVTRFIMSHEKGHHLQRMVWPNRDYRTEHHLMEIEADLIGAWALASRNSQIDTTTMIDIVKQFDDANRIAQGLGFALGDSVPNAPHHPWAEQRELALVRGPEIAILYRETLTADTRQGFAEDLRSVAREMQRRGL